MNSFYRNDYLFLCKNGMKLSYLKLVKTVAEEGSLSKACERLYLSQPALSHQLKELEDYCKEPVFKRIGKKMILTEIGKTIFEKGNQILDNIDDLENEIGSFHSKEDIKLALASSCYTNFYWFPPVVREFYKLYPNSEINISHEATDDPHNYIVNGHVDLAIVSKKKQDYNLVFKEAFKDQLFAIVSPGHKWAKRRFVKVEEFSKEDVIIYPRPITAFQKLLKTEKIFPKRKIKVQLTEARVEMVKAGLGVSVLANWAIKPFIERGEVIPIKITSKGLHRTWYFAYLKNMSDSVHLKKLMKLVNFYMK